MTYNVFSGTLNPTQSQSQSHRLHISSGTGWLQYSWHMRKSDPALTRHFGFPGNGRVAGSERDSAHRYRLKLRGLAVQGNCTSFRVLAEMSTSIIPKRSAIVTTQHYIYEGYIIGSVYTSGTGHIIIQSLHVGNPTSKQKTLDVGMSLRPSAG